MSLLLDSLVLYLKALSVVGSAIKALRQVIDVLHTHHQLHLPYPSSSASSSSLLHNLTNTRGSGRLSSIEDRKVQPPPCPPLAPSLPPSHPSPLPLPFSPLQDLSSCWSTGSTSGPPTLQGRISGLRDWLEDHFTIILDRAEACKVQIHSSDERSALAQTGTCFLQRNRPVSRSRPLSRKGAPAALPASFNLHTAFSLCPQQFPVRRRRSCSTATP